MVLSELRATEAVEASYQENLQRGVWEHLAAIRGDTMGISKDWWAKQLRKQSNSPKVMDHIEKKLLTHGISISFADSDADRARMAEALANASQFFDSSVVPPGDLVLPAISSSGRAFYTALTPQELGLKAKFSRVHLVALTRGPDDSEFDVSSARHELSHMVDFQESTQYAAWAFMRRRQAAAEGEKGTPRSLNDILDTERFDPSEVAVEDEFGMPYMGRIYGENMSSIAPVPSGEDGTGTELSSMMIEALFSGDARFAQWLNYGGRGTTLDKELLEYVVGLLAVLGRDT